MSDIPQGNDSSPPPRPRSAVGAVLVARWQRSGTPPTLSGRPRSNAMMGARRDRPPQQQQLPLPSARRATQRQDQQEQAQRQNTDRAMLVDQAIGKLPSGFDTTAIKGIVNEHTSAVKDESKVFAPYNYIDDVIAIADPDQRRTELQKISAAMAAVDDRRKRLSALLGAYDAAQRKFVAPPGVDANFVADEEFLATQRLLLGGMDNHIPDEFIAIGPKLADRIKTLCMNDQEKKALLEQEKKGFGDAITDKHRKLFEKAIEPQSMSKLERFDFYFDQLVTTPPLEDLQAIAEVQDACIEKAHRVRDAGGTIDDVKKVLSHIPETFWPPEFVEELQAWRKTERALLQESVAESFAKQGSDKMQTVEGVCAFFADTFGDVADFAGIGEMTIVKDYMDNWRSGWGLGQQFVDACQNCDFSKISKQDASDAFDQITTATNEVCSVIKSTAEIVDTASKLADPAFVAGEFVPGLAIAIAGINLTLALKSLAEHSYKVKQSEEMKVLAKLELARRELPDGGAFVRAMDNEIGARHRQVGKDGLEVTVRGVELAGAIVELTAGPAAPAGTVLKIVGKSINYGGKIIFTNIEWGIAKQAKTLIFEAQAGNPVARMQIFEDCGLYAKMYICVLCKEGHPLSLKFIEQRGIEEEDLDTVTSMKILRELLLDSAGQQDETEVADSWLEANTGPVMKIARGIAEKVSRIGKSSSQPYDKTWRCADDLTPETWEKAKAGAIKAGWYEESTGIAAALTKLAAKLPAAEATWLKTGPTPDEIKEMTDKNIAARNALNAACQTVRSFGPMTCPHEDEKGNKNVVISHAGMCAYQKLLEDALCAKLSELDAKVIEKKLKRVDWSTTDTALSSQEWKTNWALAVKQAWLSAKEPGLEPLLKTIESLDPSTITDVNKKRKANIKKRDVLKEFTKAANSYWGEAFEVPGMRVYLTELQKTAAAEAKRIDIELFDVSWSNPEAKMSPEIKFTATSWKKTWDAACDEGVCDASAGDARLYESLQSFEATRKELDKNPKGKYLLKARDASEKAASSVYVKAAGFTTAQRDAVKGVYEHVKVIIDAAQKYVAFIDESRAGVEFGPPVEVTNLNADNWGLAYKAAVDQGALPETGKASDLKKALQTYKKENDNLEAYETKKDFKNMRTTGTKVQASLGAVVTAIGHVEGTDGYSSHKIMGKILQVLRDDATKLLNSDKLKEITSGNMRASFPQQDTFTPQNWAAIKQDAIDKGVIPDGKTGMKNLIEKATKSVDKAKKEKKPEKKPAAIEEAKAALNRLTARATDVRKFSTHAHWTGYMDSVGPWANAAIAALA